MSTGLLTRDRRASVPAPIDPRLRARRDEVARDQGRRRLRRLVAIAVVALLLVGVGLIVRSPLLDVDAVTVHGGTRSGPATLRRAVGIPLGRSMISVDPAAAKARVERLPWVARATVRRQWPGTVVVHVVERTPVAVVGTGRFAARVDRFGRVLGPASGTAPGPTVVAPAPDPGERLSRRGQAVVATLAELPASLRHEIVRARTSSAGITFVLTDGIVVQWGDQSRTSAKADALGALLEQDHRDTVRTIDVSVPTAAALTRKAPGGS